MKKDWEIKKLVDVCQIIGGGTPSKKNKNFYKGNIPWATVRDMSQDILSSTEFSITADAVNNSSTNIIPKGSIIIATRVGLGKVCILKQDTAINQDLKGIIPLNEKKLSNNYLFWYFKTKSDLIVSNGVGATVHGVKLAFINSLEIPVPPLEEQKRIVKILDEKFAQLETIKTNAQTNLQNAKDLFQSQLTKALSNTTWEIKKLGDICETGSGGTPLKGHKEYYENGTIPWLRSGEVCKKDICESELFITETGLKKSSAKLFPVNTVLVAMYGATAGQTGILRFESTTNQAICGILPNPNFVPEFIYYFFLSYKEKLVAQAVGGAQPNISQVKICNSPIPLPPLPEQKRIVKELDTLSEKVLQLQEIYTKQISDCEELKQSLLAKAFEGNL